MRIRFSICRGNLFAAFLLGIGGMMEEGKYFFKIVLNQTKSLYLRPTHHPTSEVVT